MANKYVLPPRDSVLPDGSISLGGVDSTEPLWGVEKMTDLNDIDFSPLNNPKEGYVYLLWYRPNREKKFTFFPMKDPRNSEEWEDSFSLEN